MKLVITEKNDAAQKIADLLGATKPKADKVYSTPVYRFDVDGEEWVTIGLRGHILEPDFTPTMVYKKRGGWQGVTEEGETYPAELPDALPKPPFKKKKPFTEDGVELKSWKMDALPYLVYAPIKKLPKEKEIIRKHMWPLTIIPPTCREAWIVNSADTFISLMETIASRKRFGKMKEYWVHRPLRAMYDQSAKELDLFV